MITEDYVSFEVAKLLKEKGFDEPCECLYDTENNDVSIVNGWMTVSNSELEEREFVCYSAPTLQMAIKWLRETFEIHCQVDCPIGASNWLYGIRDLNEDEWLTLRDMGDYDSYEEACEAAIKYCLENLI